jgi:hypothetical protein
MGELWSGKPPANRVPAIGGLTVNSTEPAVNDELRVTLDASDLEGDTLTAEWTLMEEAAVYGVGGDAEPVPFVVEGAIKSSSSSSAVVQMPDHPGRYRLFVVLRDGQGGAATANVSLRIPGEPPKADPRRARPATLPLVIYDDRLTDAYAPSGWIGNTDAIRIAPDDTSNPKSGRFALRCEYVAGEGFGGIVWQSPANDWGDLPGGFDLRSAKRLTFWARGASGGETVDFSAGVLPPEKAFGDSARVELKSVRLTRDWKQYTIDLAGNDMSRIKTGFGWSTAGRGEATVFFLDQIQYE